MLKRSLQASLVASSTFLALAPQPASAQSYPAKPIRIVATPAGSSGDFAARLIAQAISAPMGQPVLVENRPAGVIPGQVVSQSAPDGYTLLMSGSSLWLGPFMRKSTPFDPVRDFQPIVHVTRQPALLVVHPALPVKSVKDLIALARAHPGELNYASATLGSQNHLAAEMFNSMARTKVQRIDYKGGSAALTDLMAGRVQVMFGVLSLLTPHVKSGKLRPLGVTSAQPTVLAPGMPTVAAGGLPGYESLSNAGILGPAKMPRTVVERLNHEIGRALQSSDVKNRFNAAGAEPAAGTPEQFESVIKAERSTTGALIKQLRITED